MLVLLLSAVSSYLARPVPLGSPGEAPASSKLNEEHSWQQRRNGYLLPGRQVACDLDDEALMAELVAIDRQAKLRALTHQQRCDLLLRESPGTNPELQRLSAMTTALTRQQIGDATIDWLSDAVAGEADSYISFIGSLIDASEYIEELQTEAGLLRATLPKFGALPLLSRVNRMLCPAPTEDIAVATLARVHRPTVWGLFCDAVAYELELRSFRDEGGTRTRSWQAGKEWRLLTKLTEKMRGQLKSTPAPQGSGGNSRKTRRELRSLEYRIAARRDQESRTVSAKLPPTRRQRAMERGDAMPRAGEEVSLILDEEQGRRKVVPLEAHVKRQKMVEERGLARSSQ